MQFVMNGKTYITDSETLTVLREQIMTYRAGKKERLDCITAIMSLGLKAGRIKEVKNTR